MQRSMQHRVTSKTVIKAMGHWTIPIQWNTNYSTQIVLYNFSNLPKKKRTK